MNTEGVDAAQEKSVVRRQRWKQQTKGFLLSALAALIPATLQAQLPSITMPRPDSVVRRLSCSIPQRSIIITKDFERCGTTHVSMEFDRGPTITMYDMYATTEDAQEIYLGLLGIPQVNPQGKLPNAGIWRGHLLDPKTHDQRGVPTTLARVTASGEMQFVPITTYTIHAHQSGEDLRADPLVPVEKTAPRSWRINAQQLLRNLQATKGIQDSYDVTVQLRRKISCENNCTVNSAVYVDLLVERPREEIRMFRFETEYKPAPPQVLFAPPLPAQTLLFSKETIIDGFLRAGIGGSVTKLSLTNAGPYQHEGKSVHIPQEVQTYLPSLRAHVMQDKSNTYFAAQASIGRGGECGCDRAMTHFDARAIALHKEGSLTGGLFTAEFFREESENSFVDDTQIAYVGFGRAAHKNTWIVGAYGGVGQTQTPWTKETGLALGGIAEIADSQRHAYAQATVLPTAKHNPLLVSIGGEVELGTIGGAHLSAFVDARRFLLRNDEKRTSSDETERIRSTGEYFRGGISIDGLWIQRHSRIYINDKGEEKRK